MGGAKKVVLPLDFEKIDGTYKQTKTYLENMVSDNYKTYITTLEKYHKEQKTASNRKKFNYLINPKG